MTCKVIYTRRYLAPESAAVEEYVIVETSTYRKARNLVARVNGGDELGRVYVAADAHGPPFVEYGAMIVQ